MAKTKLESFRTSILVVGLYYIAFMHVISYSEATTSENFCDVSKTYNVFETNCINCWQNRKVRCPRGARRLTRGAGTRGCRYEVQVGPSTQPARGCTHQCRQTIVTTTCCGGYWGQDCQSCPKDAFGTECGGRGRCSDGVSGNGTCLCRENLTGSLCETCTNSQFYGSICESVCACVHGTCDNGINGTGACYCETGYGGKLCDQVLQSCVSLDCHDNASCLNVSNTVGCVCNKGYTGDGQTCSEINPCTAGTNEPCSANATCVHTGPDQSTCRCKAGYSGDGVWCQAIDPCQTRNGECASNSTICVFDGPAQSHCKCRNGFENYTAGVGCQVIDICGQYVETTCDKDAFCDTVVDQGSITVKCTCPPGSVELNRVCYYDLLAELTKINETGRYANQLNQAIGFFKLTYSQLLFNPSLWTLFAPIDSAFPLSLGTDFAGDSLWKVRARAHIVAGTISTNFSESSAKTMYPLLGHDYPISLLRPGQIPDKNPDDDDAGYFADLKFVGKVNGKILSDARPATNGMIYITDTLMEPSDSQKFIPNSSTLEALNTFENLSNFTLLLSRSYSFRRKLMAARYYSLFAPTNEAMAALSDDENLFITSYLGRSALEELLSFNMIIHPVYPMISIARENMIRSTESILVNVSDVDGTVTLGKEQAKILKSEITVSGSQIYIYIVDRLLIPDSIKPLVKNRCIDVVDKQTRGPCGNCGQTRCPPNGTALPQDISAVQVCMYRSEVQMADGQLRYENKMGCDRLCSVTETSTKCCPGFYGSGCRSCPGPVQEVCNSHGICSDTETGTGLCTCNTNFTGPACETCTNGTKYGPTCSQDCLCQHGTCRNVIDSHGECNAGSCADGWAGENCDRRITLCANGTLSCHEFASCVVELNGNASCVCDPGYTGSGKNCIPFNPCQDLRSSRCSLNAFCLHLGGGKIACECLPHFSGNGRKCAPIDNCASPSRGGCSENAICIFDGPGKHECQCNRGYRGDGRICTEINICEVDNGGCSQRAQCTKTGPGTKTCACYDGYEGDGVSCTGNLLQEIALRSDLSQLQNWITRWPTIKYLFMNLGSGFTCFLPDDSAWASLSYDENQFWINERHLPYLLKNHITQRKLLSTDLITLKGQSILSMLPSVNININKVTVGTTDKNLEDQTQEQLNLPTIGKKLFAKLMVSDIPVTTNGVIHIIDSVMLPPRDVVKDYPTLSAMLSGNINETGFADYSKFMRSLNVSGIIGELEGANSTPYTLFLGPNVAANYPPSSLPAANLTAVLRYHIIKGKLIRGVDVSSGQHETTLLGPGYMVTLVRRHDSVLVNGLSVLTVANRTETGIIYRLTEKVLEPVKTRCDRFSIGYKTTTCLPCFYPHRCPTDSDLVSKTHCLFSHKTGGGAIKTSVGCQLKCAYKVMEPKCCSGFFGPGCEPCPGGIGNVCFGFGTCSDGIKGNGSCTCSVPKYTGIACETCVDGKYGKTCDQQCNCKNGKCNQGIDGDGTCSCYHGFRGRYCDQVSTGNSCNSTCHTAANCVPLGIGSGTKCICIAGYKGDGTDCQPVNACTDRGAVSGCHELADCIYISPGVHNCTCKANYEGDGRYCSPLNPCFKRYAPRCSDNADCFMIAPNMSRCVCRVHYEGDGKTCSPVNSCETDNGGCSENAICKSTGPGTRECRCKDDYFGDGVNCIGSIFSYVSGRPEFEWFTLMDSFASLAPHILNQGGPLMVFLPSQALMMQQPSSWLNYEEPATQLYLNHIVGCVDARNLTGVTRLRTLAGDILNISKSDSGFMINNKINILGNSLKFWNGVLFQIDSPLIPMSIPRIMNRTTQPTKIVKLLQPYLTNSSDSSDPLYKNTKVLLDNGFQWVVTLLETAGSLDSLQYLLHNPWTLFLPTEDAFHLQPAQRLRSFLNSEDPTYAKEYIGYHMIREAFIDPTAFMSSRGMDALLRTMQGSNINLRCADSSRLYGELVVNDGMATVIGFDVFHFTTQTGKSKKAAIYIIDKVLEPPSIGGRCDLINNVDVQQPCTLCVAAAQKCTGNSTLVDTEECTMAVPSDGRTISIPGCQITCSGFDITHKCCPHHYGESCHACPGGMQNPCSGNGQCSEGIDGTGECKCKPGFIGSACEQCDTARYGRNCLPCPCSLYGHCAEGISGDGRCFCDLGWGGPKCSQKLADDASCDPRCHRNGYCVKSRACICKPGYQGDGVNSCEFMDMCQVDNGGCSIHASCSIVLERVVCKCLPNFLGDGYYCEGNDPCTTSTSRCHIYARCVNVAANVSSCVCNPGYRGDGVDLCTKKQPANCAVGNGGCSGRATCVDNPPGSSSGIPSTNCTCQAGYVGDGIVCHGTVFDVISESFEMRNFFRQLRRQPPRIKRQLNNPSLRFTVFVPTRDPFVRRPAAAIQRHIVSGEIYHYEDLKGMKSILMRSGNSLPVRMVSNDVYVNGVRVVKSDIIATNGVVHVVESFITAKIVQVTTPATSITPTRKTPTPSTKKTEKVSVKTSSTPLSIPTVKPGRPIDKEVTSKSASSFSATTASATKSSTTTPAKRDTATLRRRSNGIKIGVSVVVIAIIMVAVGVIYWWRYHRNGGFRPFSERLNDTGDEEPFAGLTNPAYDSTGFNTTDDDDVVLREAGDDALAMRGDEGLVSFENPTIS